MRNFSSIIFSIKLNDYLDEIYNAIKEKYPTITCSVNGVNYTYSIENRLNYYIQYGSVSFPFKQGQEHTVSIY